jgi:hypothetical protein
MCDSEGRGPCPLEGDFPVVSGYRTSCWVVIRTVKQTRPGKRGEYRQVVGHDTRHLPGGGVLQNLKKRGKLGEDLRKVSDSHTEQHVQCPEADQLSSSESWPEEVGTRLNWPVGPGKEVWLFEGYGLKVGEGFVLRVGLWTHRWSVYWWTGVAAELLRELVLGCV